MSIGAGYVKPCKAHNNVFTETLNMEGFKSLLTHQVSTGINYIRFRYNNDTWVEFSLREGKIFVEWGELAV
jgi:hypothetical protein